MKTQALNPFEVGIVCLVFAVCRNSMYKLKYSSHHSVGVEVSIQVFVSALELKNHLAL